MVGYRSMVVADGEAAKEALRRQVPDLLILDVWMEHIDSGWRLLTDLQSDGRTRTLPVIVYSANVFMLAEMQRQFKEPHYAFLLKPFKVDQLLATVKALIHGSRVTARGG